MRRGFTLLEVLVAMSILIVIVAVVYASFASVADTISVARVRTEEMRLRQFLERSLRTNLTSVYIDKNYEQQVFQFIGTNDENTVGPRDSLRLVSTNALMGGFALPGDFKEIRYEVYGGEEGRLQIGVDKEKQDEFYDTDLTPDQAKLEATETPLLASNAQAVDADTGNLDLTQTDTRNQDVPVFEAPSWSVPIRTFDVTYYDGTDWVEEWDSQINGSLPWCVRVRINFARTDAEIHAEYDQSIDIVENPDFEIVVPIPLTLGQITDGRTLAEIEGSAENADDQADAATDGGAATAGDNADAVGKPSATGTRSPSARGGRTGIAGRKPSTSTRGTRSGGVFGRGSSTRPGGGASTRGGLGTRN